MVQTSNKQGRPTNKSNESCSFTKIELIKQKNRERHKLALSQFFKPRDNKFKGYKKSEILRMIIKEFKIERNMNSRSWPKWLSELE